MELMVAEIVGEGGFVVLAGKGKGINMAAVTEAVNKAFVLKASHPELIVGSRRVEKRL